MLATDGPRAKGAEGGLLNAGNWTREQVSWYPRFMHPNPTQIRLLHVLFCFAQADRDADPRLLARLLHLSQRALSLELQALRGRGWVEGEAPRLSPSGLSFAGRLRSQGNGPAWSEAA